MANSRDSGVLFVDAASTSFNEGMEIQGVKYIGNTAGTAIISNRNSSDPLWEESGTSNAYDNVKIKASEGITVTITNGAAVYIYLNA